MCFRLPVWCYSQKIAAALIFFFCTELREKIGYSLGHEVFSLRLRPWRAPGTDKVTIRNGESLSSEDAEALGENGLINIFHDFIVKRIHPVLFDYVPAGAGDLAAWIRRWHHFSGCVFDMISDWWAVWYLKISCWKRRCNFINTSSGNGRRRTWPAALRISVAGETTGAVSCGQTFVQIRKTDWCAQHLLNAESSPHASWCVIMIVNEG